MATHFYIVYSNPVAGREDEYNEWYSKQHLDDVVKVPGMVSAQRFKAQDPDNKLRHKYMTIYEMDTDDVQKTYGELVKRAGTPEMFMSPALDLAGISEVFYDPITAQVRAK